MNINPHKLINCLLIMLLMFSPLHNVMALQIEQCHSQTPATMQSDVASDSTFNALVDINTASPALHQHHQLMSMTESVSANEIKNAEKCCCDDMSNCVSNCDSGMVISLVLQQTLFSPVYIDASKALIIASSLLVREVAPPSRPPAVSL